MKMLRVCIMLLLSVTQHYHETCAQHVQESFEFVVGYNDRYSETQIIYQAYNPIRYQLDPLSGTAIWTIYSSDKSCMNPKLSVSTVNFYLNYTIYVNYKLIGSCKNDIDLYSTTIELRNCSNVSKYPLSPFKISNETSVIIISFIIETETTPFLWYKNWCPESGINYKPWCPVLYVYDFFATMTIDCDTANDGTNTHENNNNTIISLGCCKLRLICFQISFE